MLDKHLNLCYIIIQKGERFVAFTIADGTI